jgi:hypothetical protein
MNFETAATGNVTVSNSGTINFRIGDYRNTMIINGNVLTAEAFAVGTGGVGTFRVFGTGTASGSPTSTASFTITGNVVLGDAAALGTDPANGTFIVTNAALHIGGVAFTAVAVGDATPQNPQGLVDLTGTEVHFLRNAANANTFQHIGSPTSSGAAIITNNNTSLNFASPMLLANMPPNPPAGRDLLSLRFALAGAIPKGNLTLSGNLTCSLAILTFENCLLPADTLRLTVNGIYNLGTAQNHVFTSAEPNIFLTLNGAIGGFGADPTAMAFGGSPVGMASVNLTIGPSNSGIPPMELTLPASITTLNSLTMNRASLVLSPAANFTITTDLNLIAGEFRTGAFNLTVTENTLIGIAGILNLDATTANVEHELGAVAYGRSPTAAPWLIGNATITNNGLISFRGSLAPALTSTLT